MRDASRKAEWLALPSYLGRAPEIPAAWYAWTALSEACHHRDYDIGLTQEELRAHLATARTFVKLVAAKLDEAAAP